MIQVNWQLSWKISNKPYTLFELCDEALRFKITFVSIFYFYFQSCDIFYVFCSNIAMGVAKATSCKNTITTKITN